MTIHPQCGRLFTTMMDNILTRAEMDEAVFQVIERTGRDFDLVRKAIDPAMSTQNVEVQSILREFLRCECPIIREERRGR